MDISAHSPNLVVQEVQNAQALALELQWLAQVLDARVQAYFFEHDEPLHFNFAKARPPILNPASNLAKMIAQHDLCAKHRLILALALTPYIRPQLLDVFFVRNKHIDRGYTEFGGLQAQGHSGFLPTIETALFVLAGDSLGERFAVTQEFDDGAVLFGKGILDKDLLSSLEPWTSSVLTMPKSMLDHLTTGAPFEPVYGRDFPAKKITTKRNWESLVLPESVINQLKEIADWVKYSPVLMKEWGMET
ncbi:MAG: hypothetical protein ACJAW1_000001, partial [Glaciecola sp.]